MVENIHRVVVIGGGFGGLNAARSLHNAPVEVTLWCGLLRLAFESVPELKALVDLPLGHHYYAMLFGHPAVHFARTVQRDNAATIKRVKSE